MHIYKHTNVFINDDRLLLGVLSCSIPNKTIIDEVQLTNVTNIKFLRNKKCIYIYI